MVPRSTAYLYSFFVHRFRHPCTLFSTQHIPPPIYAIKYTSYTPKQIIYHPPLTPPLCLRPCTIINEYTPRPPLFMSCVCVDTLRTIH